MGSAIECFPDAGAIVVPRTRFAPVKTTSDLLAVRSDAYELTDDSRVVLHPDRNGSPPTIQLDNSHYKLVDQLDTACAAGIPSLRHCSELRVEGPVKFEDEVVLRGKVVVKNSSPAPAHVKPGVYEDVTVDL
jgi:hypothetical protein